MLNDVKWTYNNFSVVYEMELSYRWRKRAFVTLEMCFINSSWSSRRGGIAAEGPQPQTALWLNHIYYSAKPEPFV